MGKLGKFFKKIDIFGRKTELKMQKQSKYKTKLGGCFTLVMITLCVLLFFNFGSDMMNHNNPTSIFSESFKPFPDETFFSKEKYFFMFGIEAPNYTHFIDETYYKATVINAILNKNGTFTPIPVPIERCTEDHLPSDPSIKQYFLSATGAPVTDLYCIKKGLDNQFKLYGSFDVAIYQYLDINIEICRNSTDPEAPVCKPLDEIKTMMSGYFAFYTMDYLIDPENYRNPGKAVGKDYFSPISVGVTRNTNRYIATTRFNSDDGFLFSTKNEYIYPTYIEDKETFLIDSMDSGALVQFRLRKHHNEMNYNRRYKKLQNVMAEMGGFIQVLYLCFFVLTYPFVYKNYYERIINAIYNFEMADDEQFNSSNSKNSNNKYLSRDFENNPNSRKKINPLEPLSIILSNNLKSESKMEMPNTIKKRVAQKESLKKNEKFIKYMIKIQNKPPLKTSFWEFLKGTVRSIFCYDDGEQKKVKKYKQLQVGRDSITEKLDISYILKKFYEIDKLKMLFLDKNQYHLFEYLPKPVIKKNNKIDLSYNLSTERKSSNRNQMKFISYEGDVISKAKKVYTAYQNTLQKGELSELDAKLIDLMDDNVKKLLQKNNNPIFQRTSVVEQIKMRDNFMKT